MLPSSLDFNPKEKSIRANNFRMNIQTTPGGSYTQNQTIKVSLPPLSTGFCDLKNSYLKFEIKTANDTAAVLDKSVYSLFKRITTFTGHGTVIERLNNVGAYYNTMLDFKSNIGSYKNAIGNAGLQGLPSAGYNLKTTALQFCVPFHHGLFSSEKMIPCFTDRPIRMEFELEANANIALSSDVANNAFTLENVEFVAACVDFEPSDFAMLKQSSNNFKFSFEGVENYQDSVTNGSTSATSQLPFRYSSLKNILLIHRNQANLNAEGQLTQSNRSAANMTQLSYFLNGSRIPIKPLKRITGGDLDQRVSSEMFVETYSTINSVNDMMFTKHTSGLMVNKMTLTDGTAVATALPGNNFYTFEVENGTLANANVYRQDKLSTVGSFAVAIDFTKLKAPELKSDIYDGLNSTGNDIFSEIVYATIPAQMLLDYYCNYTATIMIDENNQIQVFN